MLELTEEEAKTLLIHLAERQEGRFFMGEIVYIIEKLEKFLNKQGQIVKGTKNRSKLRCFLKA